MRFFFFFLSTFSSSIFVFPLSLLLPRRRTELSLPSPPLLYYSTLPPPPLLLFLLQKYECSIFFRGEGAGKRTERETSFLCYKKKKKKKKNVSSFSSFFVFLLSLAFASWSLSLSLSLSPSLFRNHPRTNKNHNVILRGPLRPPRRRHGSRPARLPRGGARRRGARRGPEGGRAGLPRLGFRGRRCPSGAAEGGSPGAPPLVAVVVVGGVVWREGGRRMG